MELRPDSRLEVADAPLARSQPDVAVAPPRPSAGERLRGSTLRRWLQRDARAVADILRVFGDVGDALFAAHSAGRVHCGFTPDHVFVGPDGRVRLTDFGLVVDDSAYLAPEQVSGLPTEARTDQFAFAVALYEALYGERPFAGDNLEQLQRAIAAGSVRPPPSGTDVPSWVRRALLRALHSDAPQRWPSMRELLEVLRFDPLAGPRRRRRFAAAAAGLATLALALGVCGWLLWGAHP